MNTSPTFAPMSLIFRRVVSFCIAFAFLANTGYTCTAQNASINFDNTTIDLGDINNYANDPWLFDFEYSGKFPFNFLPASAQKEFRIAVPAGSFTEEKTGTIRVWYYPTEVGPFEETVQVFTNLGSKPLTMVIKGNIKSFAPEGPL